MTPEEIRSHLDAWGEVWGTPGLGRELRVRPSKRMYRALGCYSPARDEIRIAAHLLESGGRELFLEVLGHEAAHAAVRRLHPNRVRPHGPEWKRLMRQAGLVPRAALPVPAGVATVVADRRAKRRAARRSRAAAAVPERLPVGRVKRWMEEGIEEIRRELERRGLRR